MKIDDNQAKNLWCAYGEAQEREFVRNFHEKLGVIINPQKWAPGHGKYTPDLLNIRSGRLGDLKRVKEPFFKSGILHDCNPQFTVTFNVKDAKRYYALYPALDIYFWVTFQAEERFDVEVKPLDGVWMVPFSKLFKYLYHCEIHEYLFRVGDTKGNAKDSFLCDLRNFRKVA